MSKFTTKLSLDVIGDQAYEVTKPLVWEDSELVIQVNPGFDFDGASVPRVLWSAIGSPMTGGYQRAGCLHDALYASEYFPRAMCDQLFLNAMKSDGVGYAKRYAMYWAVRSAGWTVWKGHKSEEVSAYKKFVTVISNVAIGL